MSITAVPPGAKADRQTLTALVWAHAATWIILFFGLLGVALWALSQDDDRLFPWGGVGAMLFGTAAILAAALATMFVVPAVLIGSPRPVEQLRVVCTLTCLLAVVTSVPVGAWFAFAAVRSLGPVGAVLLGGTATLLFTLLAAILTLVFRIYRSSTEAPSTS